MKFTHSKTDFGMTCFNLVLRAMIGKRVADVEPTMMMKMDAMRRPRWTSDPPPLPQLTSSSSAPTSSAGTSVADGRSLDVIDDIGQSAGNDNPVGKRRGRVGDKLLRGVIEVMMMMENPKETLRTDGVSPPLKTRGCTISHDRTGGINGNL